MTPSEFLIAPIFWILLILTMVGLEGGLIFSLLPAILGFTRSTDALALLFLNLSAIACAAYTSSPKKMVNFSLAIPLLYQWIAIAHFSNGKSRRYRNKNLKGTGKCLRP